MKYCEFCGATLGDNSVCVCEEAQKKAASKQKFIKLMPIIGGIIVLVLLISLISAALGKINPAEYVSFQTDGYDGTAIAEVELDTNTLICQILGDSPEGLEEYLEWEEKYEAIQTGIFFSCEPCEQLKNGDTVVVTVETRDEAAKHIKSEKLEFKVSGLTTLEKVDFFKNIEFSVEGVSGEAVAKIIKNNDLTYVNDCDFSIDPKYALSNGDTVTVSITNADSLAKQYEIQPVEIKKEFKISGLKKYVTSSEELPSKLIEDLAKTYLEETKKDLNDGSFSYFTHSNVELFGSYLCLVKEDSWESHKNELRIYIHYDEYMDGEFFRSIYEPIVFKNVVLAEDGSVNIKYEDGVSSYFSTDFQEHLEKSKEDFEVIKIS